MLSPTRRVVAPPVRRSNSGRWLSAFLGARHAAAGAVTDAGDVTSTELVWGYAVRREWRDGTHDLFGLTPDVGTAQRWLGRDEGFWRSGPVRPVAVYLVPASAAAVIGHPVGGCRSSSCPDVPERGQR